MNDIDKSAIIAEARRQEEACLYTSTTLYIWLRSIRRWRAIFVITPIVLGGIGSWAILKGLDNPWATWGTAACSLLAGMFPAIFKALQLDGYIAEISRQAAQFKCLQDKFRQLATLNTTTSVDEMREELTQLMRSLDAARSSSITPPERYFKSARKKIGSGHYDFSVDE